MMKKIFNILYFILCTLAADATTLIFFYVGGALADSQKLTTFTFLSMIITSLLMAIGVVSYFIVFMLLMRRRFKNANKYTLLLLALVGILITGSIQYVVSERYFLIQQAINRYYYYTPLYTSCYKYITRDTSFSNPIDISECTPCERRYESWQLGSDSVTVKGKEGDNCIIEYFREIEMGGDYRLCTIPIDKKMLSLERERPDTSGPGVPISLGPLPPKEFSGRCKTVRTN